MQRSYRPGTTSYNDPVIVMFLLLGALLLQDDPATLVDRLRSDGVVEQEEKAGLGLQLPDDPPPAGSGGTMGIVGGSSWTLADVLRLTLGFQCSHALILEDDRIRVVYQGDAVRFWERWWV